MSQMFKAHLCLWDSQPTSKSINTGHSHCPNETNGIKTDFLQNITNHSKSDTKISSSLQLIATVSSCEKLSFSYHKRSRKVHFMMNKMKLKREQIGKKGMFCRLMTVKNTFVIFKEEFYFFFVMTKEFFWKNFS